MTDRSATDRPPRWTGWVPGLVLGVVSAVTLLELGVIGLGIVIASLLLIAWKGPRALATAGLITGLGTTWTLLFVRVMLSCAAQNATPGEACEAPNIGAWVAAGAAITLVGVGMSILAARRSRS